MTSEHLAQMWALSLIICFIAVCALIDAVISHFCEASRVSSAEVYRMQRVMIERFGNTRFLLESLVEIISKDNYGELYQCPTADGLAPIQMVKLFDSSHPELSYYMRVPPNLQTAHQAVAWMYKRKPEDYAPQLET